MEYLTNLALNGAHPFLVIASFYVAVYTLLWYLSKKKILDEKVYFVVKSGVNIGTIFFLFLVGFSVMMSPSLTYKNRLVTAPYPVVDDGPVPEIRDVELNTKDTIEERKENFDKLVDWKARREDTE